MADWLGAQITDLTELNRTLLIDKVIRSHKRLCLHDSPLLSKVVIEFINLTVLQLATLGLQDRVLFHQHIVSLVDPSLLV